MRTRKILIVGAGGIGSWMAPDLDRLIKTDQLPNTIIKFVDYDTVDLKNLPYQNFNKTDIMDPKAEIIAVRYGMEGETAKITNKSQLNGYDCIVCAVDNTSFRKLLFEYVFKDNKDVYWIDLRSEGKSYATYTKSKKHSYKSMLDTLPDEDVEDGSCQNAWELEQGIVQRGNVHAASYGVSYILNWFRDDPNPSEFIHTL
jgi:molybdopterin/thiamine biosynthesis adenylyltransferase